MEAFGGPRWVTAGVNPAYRRHPSFAQPGLLIIAVDAVSK